MKHAQRSAPHSPELLWDANILDLILHFDNLTNCKKTLSTCRRHEISNKQV